MNISRRIRSAFRSVARPRSVARAQKAPSGTAAPTVAAPTAQPDTQPQPQPKPQRRITVPVHIYKYAGSVPQSVDEVVNSMCCVETFLLRMCPLVRDVVSIRTQNDHALHVHADENEQCGHYTTLCLDLVMRNGRGMNACMSAVRDLDSRRCIMVFRTCLPRDGAGSVVSPRGRTAWQAAATDVADICILYEAWIITGINKNKTAWTCISYVSPGLVAAPDAFDPTARSPCFSAQAPFSFGRDSPRSADRRCALIANEFGNMNPPFRFQAGAAQRSYRDLRRAGSVGAGDEDEGKMRVGQELAHVIACNEWAHRDNALRMHA